MRVPKTVIAAVAGGAISAAATAAILVPLGAAAADTEDDASGECVTSREAIALADAADPLAEEGYTPAEGDLDGYEIGYVPGYVDGTPYDVHVEGEADSVDPDEDMEDGEESDENYLSRDWLPDEVYRYTENWEEETEEWVDFDSQLTVTVERSEDYTDIDAVLEEGGGSDDYFEGEDVQELPDGDGYYTGYEAVWVPESGVLVTVWLGPEGEDDEWPDGGSPEEIQAIVDGIQPADA